MNRLTFRTLPFKTLLVQTAGFLGVASLSVFISLPGLSQQSPNNTSPSVPSTVQPTNPGGLDAGTTSGGENLNRVPGSDSTTQQNNSTGQPSGTLDGVTPSSRPDGSSTIITPAQSGTYSQPDANQPGTTTGGNVNQQVEPNNGSTMQQNQTTPQGSSQSTPQQGQQSTPNAGSTTDGSGNTQTPSTGGSVRALW